MSPARRPTRPRSLTDWFDLGDLSAYVERKGERLAAADQVRREPGLDSKVIRAGLVKGDSRRWYRCWVNAAGQGACERGGVHDHQPDGEACSHAKALAVVVADADPAFAALAGITSSPQEAPA